MNSREERIDDSLSARLDDLYKLWEAYNNGEEDVEDLGNIYEYGLCFDYVAPNTFNDQKVAYFRYQLSWGGPSDEFRFYVNPDLSVYDIEYWFLDWNDGAFRNLAEPDYALMEEIFNWFRDMGTCETLIEKSIEEANDQD